MSEDVLECKNIDLGMSEIKAEESTDGSMTFSGYGAYFGNVDSWGDVINHGAFTDTLAQAVKSKTFPPMFLQHGGSYSAMDYTPVGVWTKFEEDEKGLYMEGTLAPTSRGKDLYALMKMKPRPAINGLSISFYPKDVSYPKEGLPDAKGCRRVIKKCDLREVSIVTFPANAKTRITDVKAEDMSIRSAERLLKSEGFSSSESKRIISLMKQAFGYTVPDPVAPAKSDLVEWAEKKQMDDAIREILYNLKNIVR